MQDVSERGDDDISLFETLIELLEEFKVSGKLQTGKALKSCFQDVVEAVAKARGLGIPAS